jgi:hypothetical protein
LLCNDYIEIPLRTDSVSPATETRGDRALQKGRQTKQLIVDAALALTSQFLVLITSMLSKYFMNSTEAVLLNNTNTHSPEFFDAFTPSLQNRLRVFSCPVNLDKVNFTSLELFGEAQSLGRLELPIVAIKQSKITATLAQTQKPARSIGRHLLHRRFDARSF